MARCVETDSSRCAAWAGPDESNMSASTVVPVGMSSRALLILLSTSPHHADMQLAVPRSFSTCLAYLTK